MKHPGRHIDGFTLAELLVVIAIIGLLSALVLVNFQSGRRSTELRGAATKLLQDIRLAQSYTIAGNSIRFCQPPPLSTANVYMSCHLYTDCGGGAAEEACKTTIPTNGYGIYLGSQYSYQLFGDTNPDGLLNPTDDYQITDQDNSSKGIYLTRYVLHGQSASDVYDLTTATPAPLTITFSPPEGTTKFYVNGTEDTAHTTVDITVKSSYVSSYCRIVTVNRISGQVSENQGNCS
ncbi:MAG: prepilin-type N-terminal cleavage/methylation domain-containing protein [Patescibacteria group bacterium]